jgi:hypothetical protein
MFTTSTLLASVILFHGLNTAGGAQTFSLLCGQQPPARIGLTTSSCSSSQRLAERVIGHAFVLGSGEVQEIDADARHSTGLYRVGGAVVGGVQPLFDYDRATEGKIQVGAGGGFNAGTSLRSRFPRLVGAP